MTPRKGETREEFRKRQAEYDATPARRDRHQAPAADPAYVRDLEKQVAALTAEKAAREAEEREMQLAGSMRFATLALPAAAHVPGSPGMPMTAWSDWHCGEAVDLRETGGLNEFNREIFEARVGRLVNRTIMLLRDYAGAVPEYPGLWVLLVGDMVSGLIHDELVATNWGNIVEQAMLCGAAIKGALLALADEFCGPAGDWHKDAPQIHVAGVQGNHGRTTLKPKMKGRGDSYDIAIYRSLAANLADDPRFAFHITTDTDLLINVYGHRFLVTHGDSLGVKGGDGIIGALGPIARGLVKLRTAESQVGRDFDTLVMGHWHQYIPRGDALPVIVNGTLKGYDEYARLGLRARFAKPSQALWLVAPKHGVAAQWCVYV